MLIVSYWELEEHSDGEMETDSSLLPFWHLLWDVLSSKWSAISVLCQRNSWIREPTELLPILMDLIMGRLTWGEEIQGEGVERITRVWREFNQEILSSVVVTVPVAQEKLSSVGTSAQAMKMAKLTSLSWIFTLCYYGLKRRFGWFIYLFRLILQCLVICVPNASFVNCLRPRGSD